MKVSLNKTELCRYLQRQLDVYLPDGYVADRSILLDAIDIALIRCEECFKHILLPGYRDGEEPVFSHLHMDQYATFIYFLGNTLWSKYSEKVLCDKLLNLNRILNGFFLSYKCPMPKIFILAHPVGSIIGNANYSDGLYISQNVTINTHTDENGQLDLTLGKGVFLGAGAKIIGNGNVGDRVSIGVDALIYNRNLENDSVCIRDESGATIVRPRIGDYCEAQRFFDIKL